MRDCLSLSLRSLLEPSGRLVQSKYSVMACNTYISDPSFLMERAAKRLPRTISSNSNSGEKVLRVAMSVVLFYDDEL